MPYPIIARPKYRYGPAPNPSPAQFMLASHMVVPNYRLNTSTPATDANQTYHVSAITISRPLWNANNLLFAWQNSYTNTFGTTPAELLPPTEIAVRAAVYDFNNNFIAEITFNGQAQITLQPGDLTWCDPVPYAGLGSGDLVVRTYSALPSTGLRPGRRARDNVNTRIFGTSSQSAALALLSSNTSVSNAGTSAPNNYAFGPVCQAADNWDGRPVVLIVGDSIAAGNDNSLGESWLSNAVRSGIGGEMAYYNMAIHGTRASNQTGDAAYGQKAAIIDTLKSKNGGALPMTTIISEMGVNDAGGTDVASLQAKVQAWLAYINSKWPAAKLIQTTYTPRVTPDPATLQTDAAVMLANTVTPANADRWGVADWIKTTPAPLGGFIDVREAWTGSPTGTIWRIPPYSSTLAASAAIGATSISVVDAPPVGSVLGIVPVIAPGNSTTVESTNIPVTSITGSGPYTITLGKALTKAHAAGDVIKASPSIDGLHPEEGAASYVAQQVVEQAKVSGVIV